MSLKKIRPLGAASRGTVLFDSSAVSRVKPQKSLSKGVVSTGGRSNQGRITVRHIGGVGRRKYRFVDFKRRKANQPGCVETIEYDPFRNSYISLVRYEDDTLSYILSPDNISVGDMISSGVGSDIVVGNAMPLSNIPVGTLVHNIELKVGKGGQIARAAGCYAQIVSKDKGYTLLRLRSGQLRYVLSGCYATVGSVSNPEIKNTKLGKAGRSRWRGVRPTVRGVAMNPVDHPLGGGEGRTSGGRHPVSPWGVLAKGKKTRKKKSSDKYINN